MMTDEQVKTLCDPKVWQGSHSNGCPLGIKLCLQFEMAMLGISRKGGGKLLIEDMMLLANANTMAAIGPVKITPPLTENPRLPDGHAILIHASAIEAFDHDRGFLFTEIGGLR
jgi:hypothetical protein